MQLSLADAHFETAAGKHQQDDVIFVESYHLHTPFALLQFGYAIVMSDVTNVQ